MHEMFIATVQQPFIAFKTNINLPSTGDLRNQQENQPQTAPFHRHNMLS